MRVAVFASHTTPKTPIYEVLDGLHEEYQVEVISWNENQGGKAVASWAERTPWAKLFTVSSVRASDTRWMGQFFDSRAAIITCFKLYRPDRALVFSHAAWLTSGVGRLVAKQAEKWLSPVHLFEPPYSKKPHRCRVVQLCDKRSPRGRICTRFKGHPSAWHWSTLKGERRSKFWAP